MSGNKRRAEIIRILRGTKQTTIPRLADTLKVSISTIKRDILATKYIYQGKLSRQFRA